MDCVCVAVVALFLFHTLFTNFVDIAASPRPWRNRFVYITATVILNVFLGLAIGNGVYFAVTSAYSIGYCGADASGNKQIYLARVLTGKSAPGRAGLKEPPPGYDSVTGGGSMYVVFYDAQTYPEYLITFK